MSLFPFFSSSSSSSSSTLPPLSLLPQLLDAMHKGLKPGELPTGILVANDANRSRLMSVCHRSRRQPRSPLVLLPSDGRYFPTLRKWRGYVRFDAERARRETEEEQKRRKVEEKNGERRMKNEERREKRDGSCCCLGV